MSDFKKEIKLAFCPFCGNEAKPNWLSRECPIKTIECTKCGIITRNYVNAKSCIKFWNTRADPHSERKVNK